MIEKVTARPNTPTHLMDKLAIPCSTDSQRHMPPSQSFWVSEIDLDFSIPESATYELCNFGPSLALNFLIYKNGDGFDDLGHQIY